MVHEMFPEHQEELNVLSESFKGEQMKFFVFFLSILQDSITKIERTSHPCA